MTRGKMKFSALREIARSLGRMPPPKLLLLGASTPKKHRVGISRLD